MAFDFDMLIHKAPHTNTAVPWHQDQAYWPNAPDKRAVSCWVRMCVPRVCTEVMCLQVALDNATVDNGCMWFGLYRGVTMPPCPHTRPRTRLTPQAPAAPPSRSIRQPRPLDLV